jgi:RNA polymerase sigma-70 factor (ECF subfamily)
LDAAGGVSYDDEPPEPRPAGPEVPVATTSLSLLERLRRQPTAPDWERLDGVCRPLVLRWLARVPGLQDEAADVAQEVMLVVVREVGRFERRREGSFRAWLRAVTVNQVRSYWRARRRRPLAGLGPDETEGFLARLEDPASALSRQWDAEHDQVVFDRLLEVVRPDFSEQTWEAFRRFAVEARPAAAVAAELGVSENAVLLAKSRVLRRLREEAGGLID